MRTATVPLNGNQNAVPAISGRPADLKDQTAATTAQTPAPVTTMTVQTVVVRPETVVPIDQTAETTAAGVTPPTAAKVVAVPPVRVREATALRTATAMTVALAGEVIAAKVAAPLLVPAVKTAAVPGEATAGKVVSHLTAMTGVALTAPMIEEKEAATAKETALTEVETAARKEVLPVRMTAAAMLPAKTDRFPVIGPKAETARRTAPGTNRLTVMLPARTGAVRTVRLPRTRNAKTAQAGGQAVQNVLIAQSVAPVVRTAMTAPAKEMARD